MHALLTGRHAFPLMCGLLTGGEEDLCMLCLQGGISINVWFAYGGGGKDLSLVTVLTQLAQIVHEATCKKKKKLVE